MFGKLLGHMTNDPQKAKDANNMAERIAGVDLDGDGTIGGQRPPPQQTVQRNNTPQQPISHAGAPLVKADGSMSKFGVAEKLLGTGLALAANGKIRPSGPGGLSALLNGFQNMSPQVQQQADVAARNLNDGRDIPLSDLHGRKKSLLIGINYVGTANELRGCINDVRNVQKWITSTFNFPSDANSMRILTDDGVKPTRANIIAGMKWLIEGAQKGDSLFIHYSGHGATQKDTSPDTDEADGQDETLVPLDYQTAGMIVDDEIFDIMIAKLPAGVRLTAIMDCCHSGSVFDLPYSYVLENGRDIPVEVDNRKIAIAAALAAGKALMAKDYGGVLKNIMEAGKAYMAMSAQGGGAAGGGGGGGGGAAGLLGSLMGGGGTAGGSQSEPSFQTPESSGGYVSPYANSNYTPAAPDNSSAGVNPWDIVQPGSGATVAAQQQQQPQQSQSASQSSLGHVVDNQNATSGHIAIRTAVCDVIQFSGCRDEQTSADAFIDGASSGAMSYALIKSFNDFGKNQTFSQVLKSVRDILYGKYKQIPQMSTGHRMFNLDGQFSM